MLIPSENVTLFFPGSSLSRRVNANSQHGVPDKWSEGKLIKKGEC